MSVILINVFEIPEGKEDEALADWESCYAIVKKAPGFISAKLHRAITPNAKFKLINVGEWETPKHFEEAISTPEFQEVVARGLGQYPHYPALFEVVRTQGADD
jgi:heme-degrading monooxygenase HmoA